MTKQAVGEPLPGRPLLEALGLNTRDILASAAAKHAGIADVPELFNQHAERPTNSKIARILEGVYHAEGRIDDADFDEDDGRFDLGPETLSEKENILRQKIDEARQEGMTTMGLKGLEALLNAISDVIKLRLDAGEPADITPLRVNLKRHAVPVRAKQRRYPPPKKVPIRQAVAKTGICQAGYRSRMVIRPTHRSEAPSGHVPTYCRLPSRKQCDRPDVLAHAEHRVRALGRSLLQRFRRYRLL